MAELRIYENLFEDECKKVRVRKGTRVLDAVAEHSDGDSYASDMVECYDPQTGRTFYAPLEEEKPDELSVLITVNDKEVSEDYIVQANDVVKVVFLPLSEGVAWDWMGFFTGGLSGLLSGAMLGGMIGGGPIGALIGGAAGFILGGFVGGFVLPTINKNMMEETSGNYDRGKDSSSLPDVRGAENQPLTGNQFPFVFGKHLITPFIIGSPYTEYTNGGKDAYIRVLLCAGYAPLKLTDFKLGDMFLAYNRTQGASHDTVLHGKLKGYSVSQTDDGDIIDYWKNNDIELEILQQKDTDSVDYGTIYDRKIVEQEVGAVPLFVADKTLDDLANVVYKGTSFPNTFRNNTVRFTEACPRKFTVNLSADSGLYSTFSDDGVTKYGSIPLWYAVQWRFFNVNNGSSDSNGSDYGDWNNITKWNGIECGEKYTSEKQKEDVEAHKGNDLSDTNKLTNEISVQEITSGAQLQTDLSSFIEKHGMSHSGRDMNFSSGLRYRSKYGYSAITKAEATILGVQTVVYLTYDNGRPDTLFISMVGKEQPNSKINTTEERLRRRSSIAFISVPSFNIDNCKIYVNEDSDSYHTGTLYSINRIACDFDLIYDSCAYASDLSKGWSNKLLTNFRRFSGENFIDQQRLSSTVELTDAQCRQALGSGNSIKGIEVRVIRVSPAYLNMTKKQSDEKGPESYSDLITWLTLNTEPFDEDEFNLSGNVMPVKPLSKADMARMCCIAVKAKADSAGTIAQQLRQINCMAESFSPYYDTASHRWMPENVGKKTGYYKPMFDGQGKFTVWAACSKDEYERGRQDGDLSYTRVKEGSDYLDRMRAVVFDTYDSEKGRYILSAEAAVYNEANAASGFLLACVGPQNGPAAMGYENINMLSLAEWYEKLEDITDGSTYDKSGSDEFGWHEKGDLVHCKFRANGYMYGAKTLVSLMSGIAVCGRAVFTYDDSGRIKIIFDEKAGYPKGVINQANVMSPTNSYSYADLPSGLQFSFNDENDGYEKNSVYCWSDNNSLASHKGSVEGYSIDYVTDPKQLWSLGRYVLACRIMQREVLTRKIGPEGSTFSLGDVVLVQGDELLIGGGSGRIKQIIEDESGIYGFVCDGTYRYTGEVDGNDVIRQGVTVLQPGKYGQSRTVTLRLARPGKITVSETEYRLSVGVTNLVLFDKVIRTGSKSAPSSSLMYDFRIDDIVLYGEMSKISQKYRITKIKPDKDRNYTCTLVPYYDELYSYGAQLPSFQPVISMPPAQRDPFSLGDTPTTMSDLQKYVDGNASTLMAKIASVYANHIVTLYKDSNIPLETAGIVSPLTYSFAENTLEWQSEAGSNGWTAEYPADPQGTVYVTSATAFGKGETDTIDITEWAKPVPVGQNGVNGINSATITLYRRTDWIDPASDMPHRIIYHFNKGDTGNNITGDGESKQAALNGWSETIPEVNEDNDPAWAIVATALSTELTDIIEPSEWSAPVKITQDGLSVSDIQNMINNVAAPPVVYLDIKQFGIAVNSEGIVTKEQKLTCTVRVMQTEEELEFTFGEIKVPDGITYTVYGNTVTFTAHEGIRINFGLIYIDVNYYAYISNVVISVQNSLGDRIYKVGAFSPKGNFLGRIASADDIPAEPTDGDYITWSGESVSSELSGSSIFITDASYVYNAGTEKWEEPELDSIGYHLKATVPTTFNLTVEYLPVRGGIYRGPVSSVDSLPSEDSLIIGDFILWTGEQTETHLTDTKWFSPAGRYQWNGHLWEKDYNAQHMASTLNDVMSIKDSYLALIDSESEDKRDIEFFKRLAAKEIFVGTLVASEIFAERLSANEISIPTGNGGCIVSDNFSLKDGTGIKIDFDRGTIYAPKLQIGAGDDGTIDTVLSKTVVRTERIYYLAPSSQAAPSKPMKEVTTTKRDPDIWTLSVPTMKAGHTYWSCTQYTYTGGGAGWGTVSVDDVLSAAVAAAELAETAGSNAISGARTIYYRKTTGGAPSAPNESSTAVSESRDMSNAWTTAVPSYASGCTYFTCTEYTKVDVSTGKSFYTYSSPTVDNDVSRLYATTQGKTIIKGGQIDTGLLNAAAVISQIVEAGSITLGKSIAGVKNTDIVLKSNNYNPTKKTGFAIQYDGTAYFNNGVFNGEVNATSGKFTGEINATSGNFSGYLNMDGIFYKPFSVLTFIYGYKGNKVLITAASRMIKNVIRVSTGKYVVLFYKDLFEEKVSIKDRNLIIKVDSLYASDKNETVSDGIHEYLTGSHVYQVDVHTGGAIAVNGSGNFEVDDIAYVGVDFAYNYQSEFAPTNMIQSVRYNSVDYYAIALYFNDRNYDSYRDPLGGANLVFSVYAIDK